MSAKQRNAIWSLDPDVAFPALEDFAEATLGQPSDTCSGVQHQFLGCSCLCTGVGDIFHIRHPGFCGLFFQGGVLCSVPAT